MMKNNHGIYINTPPADHNHANEPGWNLRECETCADCGREIPSHIYADDVHPIYAPLCTCKPPTDPDREAEEE